MLKVLFVDILLCSVSESVASAQHKDMDPAASGQSGFQGEEHDQDFGS